MLAFSLALLVTLTITAQASTYGITGVQAGVNSTSGARPFRQNINTFKNTGPAWDLYVLALQQLQAADQNNSLSWYRISGIHGYPANTPWDGVSGAGGGTGYCEHGSILFPVWHRPYLALIEMQIWNYAQNIASQYPASLRSKYQAAATTLRVPFWDWSLNATLPDVTARPSITINAPAGSTTIPNPLYAYRFHPLVSSDLPYLAQYPTTVRNPNSTTKQSQIDMVNQNLQNIASNLHDAAYYLFSSTSSWKPWSNIGGGGSYSIEALHGTIHNVVGGQTSPSQGHMTFLAYSAFDPIFWLHHANVDRLVAMWQAINPNSYIVPQNSTGQTYYAPKGTLEDINYPLAPFHDGNGNFHTGISSRYLKAFGYSYPELVDWTASAQDSAAYSSQVTAIVNNLYNPPQQSSKRSIGSALASDWQWQFLIEVDQDAVDSAVALYLFHGDDNLSTDSTTWGSHPALVGPPINIGSTVNNSMGLFSAPTNALPLTRTLLSFDSFDPSTVAAELKARTYWRTLAIGQDASNHANSILPEDAVQIKLQARTVKQSPDASSFPTYGDWTDYGNWQLNGHGRKLCHAC